jgi:hypothetical protein
VLIVAVVVMVAAVAAWLVLMKLFNRSAARLVGFAAAAVTAVTAVYAVSTGVDVASVVVVIVSALVSTVLVWAPSKVLVDRTLPAKVSARLTAPGGERAQEVPSNLGELWSFGSTFVLFAAFDKVDAPSMPSWAQMATAALRVDGGELRLVAVVDGASLEQRSAGGQQVTVCGPDNIASVVSNRQNRRQRRRK